MIYVHCKAASEGAALLAESLRESGLEARRSRDFDWLRKKVKRGDVLIGWGDAVPFEDDSVKVLNATPVQTKLRELELLEEEGIPVPPFDTTNWGEGWIGRSLHHQEGGDFLPPHERPSPSFWTRKLDIIDEYRFHIFTYPGKGALSIRAGRKVPRGGMSPHPWVRSWQHGWKISYGDPVRCEKGREAAKKAIPAVGYDFGAVDVGVLRGGEVVVLEVGSRPGFDVGGQTVMKYVSAIKEVL